MEKENSQIKYINDGVNFVCNLLSGTHNYSKVVEFLPKLLSIDESYNKKIIEIITNTAHSVNIKSEGLKELEKFMKEKKLL